MIIDAHAHVQDPVADHLRALDEAQVERSVLLPTRAHPERARTFQDLHRELASLQERMAKGGVQDDALSAAHQELHAALAEHPSRFIGFGTVPLGLSPEQTRSWIEKEIVDRGLRGIGELTPPPGAFGAVLEPVLAAAADHAALPVMVHGFAPTTGDDLVALGGLARRHPTVPIIISQLGGLHWMRAIELALLTPNLYIEISTVPVAFAARAAIHELPERTLFGSDAPYGDPVLARQLIERVTPRGEVRARVLGGTAAALLGLA